MEIRDNLQIQSKAEYDEIYRHSIDQPDKFWGAVAEKFSWQKKWDNVLKADFKKPEIEWFSGGQLNITENCLDRHLAKQGDKNAILWEPNNPHEEPRHITYKELHEKVSQFSNVLKNNGVKKGDRVCLYMPMIPELTIAMLACARIGAIHSIVFAGFSSSAIADRINDSECKLLITANDYYRGEKQIELKKICDEALKKTKSIEKVIVYRRTVNATPMQEGRDVFWFDELQEAAQKCQPEIMEAEDPLFILYTSGSTGSPKGMVHTTGGYMVGTAYTFQNTFRPDKDDVFWCTADIGWITGHSYIVYGPLCAGATTVMFEGTPTYPEADRFWAIVEKFKVNQFYTAPTAIRALAKKTLDYVQKHDLNSLKVLGSVGEPINQEAWDWYNENIGNKRCPLVDTWWQTETGSIMISTIAGITETKPTFATLPFPGVEPALMDDEGREVDNADDKTQGKLVIKKPWPAMARTIWNNHDRFKKTYFSDYENVYFSGDAAIRDKQGNYRITGRADDVIIVSGHNLGTAPIENVIDDDPKISESAIVDFPHEVKGKSLHAFVILKDEKDASEELKNKVRGDISDSIGAIAKPEKITFVSDLPKTRSGKIMRRILREVAAGKTDDLGDTSTLLNPEIVEEIIKKAR